MQEFHKIESRLNASLEASKARLINEGIEHSDESYPTYHYKNQVLTWEHVFQKEWKVDYERLYVQIRLSFSELDLPNEIIKSSISGGVYSEGRPDNFPLRRNVEVNVEQVLSPGLHSFLEQTFRDYRAQIEESM